MNALSKILHGTRFLLASPHLPVFGRNRVCGSHRAASLIAPFVLFALGAPPAMADAGDPRAVWVVRDALLSPLAIRRMVEDADRAGITDLLLQVRGRGDAYYESDLAPVPDPLRDAWRRHGRYDPLAMALDLAHERGMRVHAWLNVYLVWSGEDPPEGHVVREHPDWVAVDAGGTPMTAMSRHTLRDNHTEGVYLDPGRVPVVRRFLAVVEELLDRYPVDGIHLDYVRYPVLDVGYSPAVRRGFLGRTGVDPGELARNRAGLLRERGKEGLEALDAAWWHYKAEQVTALVRAVRSLTRTRGRRLVLSTAVKPDLEAAARVSQDWTRWVHEDLVDVVAPMMYSREPDVVRSQARTLSRVVPADRVWAGIAVYNKSLRQAERNILACREEGLSGISIFSYNSLPGGGRNLARLAGAR